MKVGISFKSHKIKLSTYYLTPLICIDDANKFKVTV